MPDSDYQRKLERERQRRREWRAAQRAAGRSTHPERDALRRQGRPIHPERDPVYRQQRGLKPKGNPARPWCFVDTEGATDDAGIYGDPGRQWTMLICAAADDGYEKSLYTGRPLTTRQMLDFLVWLPRRYKYAGYFLGYDHDQILHDLPEPTLRRLYGSGVEQGAVAWQHRYLLMIFATQLQVKIAHPDAEWEGEHPPDGIRPIRARASKIIWDVGKFYQARFSTAISNWQVATPAEQTFIESMKSDRSSFDVAYWERHHRELIRYSLLENRLGARMQEKFDQVCRDLGYPLSSWYGAGSMAKTMLKARGVRAHLDGRRPIRRPKREEDDMVPRIAWSYFGGRFEIQRPGVFKPVYEYDLRSAYPASYRSLPCLVHGEWRLRRGAGRARPGPHDLCRVDWRIPRSHVWGPFPARDRHGTISYPADGGGIVWGEELTAAARMWPLRHGPTSRPGIYLRQVWEYRTSCDCRPFDWIDEVYAERRRLGKDRAGYPLKLGMNAIYGTLASVLGAEAAQYEPLRLKGWHEPRWASMITGWCRARMLDALHAAGGPRSRAVIMFATDAIYSTEPIPLDLTDRLGGWEGHEFRHGGLLIQPGLYHLKGQALEVKLKGRGISFRDMQDRIPAFYRAYVRQGDRAQVSVHLSPRYQGIRLQLARNNLAGAWRWQESERTISMAPDGKRELRADGLWWPHELSPMTECHQPMMELLCPDRAGDPLEIPEQDVLARLEDESQPDGPMA